MSQTGLKESLSSVFLSGFCDRTLDSPNLPLSVIKNTDFMKNQLYTYLALCLV